MASFNRAILHDRLLHCLREFATTATESKQVSRRLRDLLPLRYREILSRYRPQAQSVAAAERAALTDKAYLAHIDELISVASSFHEARVQYETHMMLFEARRSLRHLVR